MNDVPQFVSIPGNSYGDPQGAASNYIILFSGDIVDLFPVNYQVSSLVVGLAYYIDRNYTISKFPAELGHTSVVLTANDDKANSDQEHVSFRFKQ